MAFQPLVPVCNCALSSVSCTGLVCSGCRPVLTDVDGGALLAQAAALFQNNDRNAHLRGRGNLGCASSQDQHAKERVPSQVQHAK